MPRRIPEGFMLIELMVVLAIAAILLAIAIPAYHGYVVRTKITEALHLAAPVKVAVAQSLQHGTAPGPGTGGANAIQSRYVHSVAVEQDSGRITMTTRNTGAQPAPVLVLTPDPRATPTAWECRRQAGRPLHVPAGCRQAL